MSLPCRAALALAMTAQAFFLLALIGQLRPLAMLVAIVAALAYVARSKPRIEWIVVLFIAAAFLLALFPPREFDETLYHLPFVRALADSGRLQFQSSMRFPVFPQFHELLCVPLFVAFGDTATHFLALLETAITIAILVEWGRRYKANILAAALFAGSPLVMLLATITYVDAALTMFVTAGLYALDRKRLARAGLLLGTACSVKYLGLFFVAAAFAYIVWRRRAPWMFITCALAAALPTTLWIFVSTGNPLFPFLGHSLWVLPPMHVSFATHAMRALRWPFDATFARAQMNQQAPLTPLLIPALLIMLFAAIRDIRARAVVIAVFAYGVALSFFPPDSRYFVPLLPLVSLIAAATVARHAKLWLAAIVIAPGLLYPAYALAMRGFPTESREQLIARRNPEFVALQHADANTIYVCGAEQLKFYARGPLLGDAIGPYAFDRILPRERRTSAIATRLRTIDARWFLNATRKCPRAIDDGGMELVYEDAVAQLWRMPQRR